MDDEAHTNRETEEITAPDIAHISNSNTEVRIFIFFIMNRFITIE